MIKSLLRLWLATSLILLASAGLLLTDGRAVEPLERIGDPARLVGLGYDAPEERTWMAVPGSVALGLGALGPSFEACRGRFGEFPAVASVAAYRPSAGPGWPDFEHAAGAFVPGVRVLYGLAFPVGRATVVRFEARGQPGAGSIPLSQIAVACLDLAEGGAVGIVIAAETDGLVGAALRRSPVGLPAGLDPFAHPEVREWLSLTPEPEHSRSTALVVGVATRAADRPGLPGPAGRHLTVADDRREPRPPTMKVRSRVGSPA